MEEIRKSKHKIQNVLCFKHFVRKVSNLDPKYEHGYFNLPDTRGTFSKNAWYIFVFCIVVINRVSLESILFRKHQKFFYIDWTKIHNFNAIRSLVIAKFSSHSIREKTGAASSV